MNAWPVGAPTEATVRRWVAVEGNAPHRVIRVITSENPWQAVARTGIPRLYYYQLDGPLYREDGFKWIGSEPTVGEETVYDHVTHECWSVNACSDLEGWGRLIAELERSLDGLLGEQ